ncbi:MAG TPA: Na/Pi cotransporter family protein [Syntrophomonas sp.]|nr:Na/Pi cotransporter family protein [Syntrophomonas sp.]HRW11876.1 Na/Pi cotransporter family protein [Syntrophomonas sp.]
MLERVVITLSASEIIFLFIGGLGLVLFGLHFMSEGLQSAAGDKIRKVLEKGTRTPLRGVLTGTLVTALIQSSSATTVLTVGLVNAQLLTLRQAIGVILGANLGTTITAYLIGFNLYDYVLPIVALGTFLYLAPKQNYLKMIGQALLGFGILLFGLNLMGEGMKPLTEVAFIMNLMAGIDNQSLTGLVMGIVFTVLVQSSGATIGVLQQLALNGVVTFHQAVPILFGANLGTTITALLAGMGASVTAKRAALTHFLLNIFGLVVFLPLFLMGFFEKFIVWLTNMILLIPGLGGTWAALNIKLQIAQTHGAYNLCNVIILIPLISALAYLVTQLIPDRDEDADDPYKPKYIDHRLLNNPSVALAQAKRETMQMGLIAYNAFNNAVDYFNNPQEALLKKGEVLENAINRLEREITDYVVLASRKQLSKEESNSASIILQSLNDIERIGDHCDNIIEQADYATRHQVQLSGEAREEMDNIISVTKDTILLSYRALEKQDKSVATQVLGFEEKIDELQAAYRKNHIRRLNEGVCNGNNGAVFLDLLVNLERIGDHCRNIAEYVLEQR